MKKMNEIFTTMSPVSTYKLPFWSELDGGLVCEATQDHVFLKWERK